MLPKGTKVCTECGAKLKKKSILKVCPSCGATIPKEAQFCPECAAQQDEIKAAKSTPVNISKEKVLQEIYNLSTSEARIVIEEYIVHTEIYQKLEAHFIEYKNRTARKIVKSYWEIYLASEINEQISNFVDYFIYCNHLEHKFILRKSILNLKVWRMTFAFRIGLSITEFTSRLHSL